MPYTHTQNQSGTQGGESELLLKGGVVDQHSSIPQHSVNGKEVIANDTAL